MTGIALDVRPARREDLAAYVAMARMAQASLMARGLAQHVPAAHPDDDAYVRARIADASLHAVWQEGRAVAFFVLEAAPSRWWPADGAPALYLAGLVVSRDGALRGRGDAILAWCLVAVRRSHRNALRLDCHAGNPWLCAWYEARGFVARGYVEQHPGYEGCLYERNLEAGG